MAFDHVGFFTIVGKFIKTINTVDGYHDAIETLKTEIRDVYEGEDLHDLYATMPSLISGFQTNFTSFINSLITDLENGLFTDRDYVLEQLQFSGSGTTAVLNALYDYMDDNSYTIQSSVVSIGGSDADKARSSETLSLESTLLCTRLLDGVNDPGNGVSAHLRYLNVESQLARSTTVNSEVTSAAAWGSETVQLYPNYSSSSGTGPYVLQDEEPTIGPTLANGISTRIGLVDPGFNNFTSDDPDSWSVSGGSAGTDWEQTTSVAAYGPGVSSGLKVNTTGVAAKQIVTGLSFNTMYMFFGVFEVFGTGSGIGNDVDWVAALKTNAGATVKTLTTTSVTLTDETLNLGEEASPDNFAIGYHPFALAETVDLADVYLELTCNNFGTGISGGVVYQVGIVPVTYWNGLGWVWLNPRRLNTLGNKSTVAVSNNDNGVFQTFFRKAFGIQLPTADSSPTFSESLAT